MCSECLCNGFFQQVPKEGLSPANLMHVLHVHFTHIVPRDDSECRMILFKENLVLQCAPNMQLSLQQDGLFVDCVFHPKRTLPAARKEPELHGTPGLTPRGNPSLAHQNATELDRLEQMALRTGPLGVPTEFRPDSQQTLGLSTRYAVQSRYAFVVLSLVCTTCMACPFRQNAGHTNYWGVAAFRIALENSLQVPSAKCL